VDRCSVLADGADVVITDTRKLVLVWFLCTGRQAHSLHAVVVSNGWTIFIIPVTGYCVFKSFVLNIFTLKCLLCILEEKPGEAKASKPKEASKEAPKAKEPAAAKGKEASKSKGKDAPKAASVKPITPKPVKTKVQDGGKAKSSGAPAKARNKALKAKKAVLHGVHNKRIRKQRNIHAGALQREFAWISSRLLSIH